MLITLFLPTGRHKYFSTYASVQIGVQSWPKWEGRIKGNIFPFCEWIPCLYTDIVYTQSSILWKTFFKKSEQI